jgi:hypothetical protein
MCRFPYWRLDPDLILCVFHTIAPAMEAFVNEFIEQLNTNSTVNCMTHPFRVRGGGQLVSFLVLSSPGAHNQDGLSSLASLKVTK